MKENIYIFLPTGKKGASSRYRVIQYNNELLKNFNIYINEFLDDAIYDKWKENNLKSIFLKLPNRIIKTILFARKIPNKSTILIHRDILPFGNMWIERYLKRKKCNIIVDLDDAIFLEDTSEISNKKNKIFYNIKYGKRYNTLFNISNKIICGNSYLESYVKKFCDKTIIIPTVIDTSKVKIKKYSNNKKDFSIVWIGNPGNTGYIIEILSIIDSLAIKLEIIIEINLIGAKRFDVSGYNNLNFIFNEWSLENEYNLIKKSDIGIMPLKDSEWAKGKCALKLLQYMAAGLPVIGSNVGENKHVIIEGENGFLAKDEQEWFNNIKYFIENRDEIPKMGINAREFVDQKYSLDLWKNSIVDFIK